jgi:carbamate kinase
MQADILLLLTDVDAIQLDYGTHNARALHEATPAELSALELPAGSMGPKADAARRFVEGGGQFAAIDGLENPSATLAGTVGTTVRSMPKRGA